MLTFVVLVWGSFLRFQKIENTQPIQSDEGFYWLEAQRITGQVQAGKKIYQIFRSRSGQGVPKLTPAEEGEVRALVSRGYGQLGGRFGHDLLLALTMALKGEEPWVGNWLSAVFGVLNILCVIAWATYLWGPRAGVFAGSFLAVSGIHVAFSRMTMAEADSLFLMLLCLISHTVSLRDTRASAAWILAAGFCFGGAFVTSFRAVPLAYGIVLSEALTTRPLAATRRLILFGLAALLPMALAEGFFHGLYVLSGAGGILLTRSSFAVNILFLVSHFKGGLFLDGGSPWRYAEYFVVAEGWLFLSAFVLGAFSLAGGTIRGLAESSLRRSEGCFRFAVEPRSVVPLLAVTFVTITYWHVAIGYRTIRYIILVVPLMALLASRIPEELCTAFPSRALPAVLTLLVLFAGTPSSWDRPESAAGYHQVAMALKARGIDRIVANQANIMRIWIPDSAEAGTLEDFRREFAQGHRWYVECQHRFHSSARETTLAVGQELRRRGWPTAVFDHPGGDSTWAWFSSGKIRGEVSPEWQAEAARINLWDLSLLFGAPGVPVPQATP